MLTVESCSVHFFMSKNKNISFINKNSHVFKTYALIVLIIYIQPVNLNIHAKPCNALLNAPLILFVPMSSYILLQSL